MFPRFWCLFLAICLLVRSSVHAQTNDAFSRRLPLTGSHPVAISNHRLATREAGEPDHAASGGGRSLWYTWTAPATGLANFSVDGGALMPPGSATRSTFPRALAVYTGDSLSTLSEVGSASNPARLDYPAESNSPVLPSLNLPVTAGTAYQIAVDGPAALYAPDDGTVVLAINQAPVISSSAGASATIGTAFAYQIQGSNRPTSFGATDLPPGLSLNPTTGNVTGVPTTRGTYTLGLSATNPGGTGTGTLTLTVGDPAPAAAPGVPVAAGAAGASGFVGAPFSYSLFATNGVRTYGASDLPPGLALDPVSGYLVGTPTAAGDYRVPLTFTNVAGTGNAVLSVHIDAAPPVPFITSALGAQGTVGSSFSYYINTGKTSSDPDLPTGYGVGSLPPGLGFDPLTGGIAGTPTVPGVYSVPLSATNAGGTGRAVLTITVSPATASTPPATVPPAFGGSATAAGQVGTAFSYALSASNSPTAFSAGNLPPGLSLNPQSGYLTGTPTTAGVYQVPVGASNAYGETAATLTVRVTNGAPASTAVPPTIISAAECTGITGQYLQYQITGRAYVYNKDTYSYDWGSGVTYNASNLPPGLSLNTIGGTIGGTPTAAGTYAVPVSVTVTSDIYSTGTATTSTTGRATVTFVITAAGTTPAPAAPPVFTSAANVAGVVGTALSTYVAASNSPTGFTAGTLPPGLTFNAASGQVSGTPTTAGSYPVAFTASNGAGTGGATVTFVIAGSTPVPAAPVLTSSATASGTVGRSFSYYLYGSNSPTGYGASNLPPGLSLDAAGTISGTPTAAGVYQIPISATNAGGTGRATLTLTVAAGPGAPVITSDATARGTVGASFSYTLYASNSPTQYAATGLPDGLSLNATSGSFTGTPTAAGVYPVAVSATNAAGTGSATVTVTVDALPPLPTFSGQAAAGGTVGRSFSYTLRAGNSPTSFGASGLPDGLGLAPSTGAITGTPTTEGVYTVPVSATNAAGTSRATLTLTIVKNAPAAAPVVTSAAAATGYIGMPFSYTITADNTPTSFQLGASPPPGLSFDAATGVLSGVPQSALVYTLPIRATNGSGTATAKLTLKVTSRPAAPPTITSDIAANGFISEPFFYAVTATGAPTSYGAEYLPPGLTLNAATGVISGTPTSTGTSSVRLLATNAAGTGSAALTVRVNYSAPGVRLTSPLAAAGVKGTAFTYSFTSNVSVYGYSVSGLPTGLSYNSSARQITGTPTVTGTFAVPVTVSTSGNSINARLTLVIGASAPATPVFSGALGVYGLVGEPFAYAVNASNGPTTYTVASLPDGLSYDAARGLITGVPTATGTSSVVLTATNAAGPGSATLTLTVNSLLPSLIRLTNPAGASGAVGNASSFALTTNAAATGYPVYGYNASGLPAGLGLNSSTGVISGTPTTAGLFGVSVYASVPGGTASGYLTLLVNPAPNEPPVITTAAGAAGTVGTLFSLPLAATNSPTDFNVTNLPAGLSFDAATNRLSGVPTAGGTFSVPVTATNAYGTGSATLTLAIAILPPTAPVLDTNSLAASAPLGRPFVYQLAATNAPTGYAASGLPPGLTLDPASGVVSGTPTQVGVFSTAISATNAVGTASAVVTFTVTGPAAPRFSGLDATVTVAVGVSCSEYLWVNGATNCTASGLPPGLYLNGAAGRIFGVPTQAGRYAVNLTAANAAGADQATLTLVVTDGGPLPSFWSSNAEQVVDVGSSCYESFIVDNATSCTASGLPPGVSYTFTNGNYLSLRGSPTTPGLYPVTITARNAAGAASEVITILVPGSASAPPLITSAAGAAGPVDTAFYYWVRASNGPVSYAAEDLPDGLQIVPSNGTIMGNPKVAGRFNVAVSATNAAGTGRAVVTLQIASAPPPPTAVPVITSAAGAGYTFVPSDYYYSSSSTTLSFEYTITADNAPTSFAAGDLPPGLTLNPATGLISGVPQTAGIFTVPISATNAQGTTTIPLTINAFLASPVLSVPLAAAGVAGTPLSYQLYTTETVNYFSFNDSRRPNSPLFSARGLPSGLSLNPGTGVISGTPARAGSFPVFISATTRAGTDSAILTFNVADSAPAAAPTSPPAFYGAATARGFVGGALRYSLAATNTTGGYAADVLPAGLSLNAATGLISGTPTQAGIYQVPVTATNAAGTGHATLTIRVAGLPTAPVVSSAGGAAGVVGAPFRYGLYTTYSENTPTPLTYGASDLPPGLSLDAALGVISGTPTAAGTFSIPLSAASLGATGRATLTLVVAPTAPAAAPVRPVFGGNAGLLGFLVNPLTYSLGNFSPDSRLPDGLVFDPAAGQVTGYPAAAGTGDVALIARNDAGAGSAVVNLRLVAPDLSLPRVTVQPASQTVPRGRDVTLTTAAVGAPAPVFRWTHDGVTIPGATGPTLSLANVGPADFGTYQATASNSSGDAASAAIVLTVTQVYGGWQTEHFTPAEIAAGLAATGADFNGDGLPNLLEYALGRDPRTGAGGGLPTVSAGAAEGLRLRFNRDAGKTDLDYTVEASGDLQTWTPIARSVAGGTTANLGGAATVQEAPGSSGLFGVTVQDAVPLGGSGHRFLRLRVLGR